MSLEALAYARSIAPDRLVALADQVLDTLARQAPVDPFAPGGRASAPPPDAYGAYEAYEPPPYDPLR